MIEKKNADVCLVMPPLTVLNQPSMALGVLKGALSDAGISCYVDYASVYFLNALGEKIIFSLFSADRNDFIAEYLFAEPAGIQVSKTLEETVKRYTGGCDPLKDIQVQKNILKAKSVAKEQVEATVERILERHPLVVGCSVTFLQRNASIAILKGIKERNPHMITILGGVGCAGNAGMEMMKTFPFIDYVFFGESDDIFAGVIGGLLKGEQFPLPYGVLKNGDEMPERAPHRIMQEMDNVPFPDFDDFFELLGMPVAEELHKISRGHHIVLTAEASRGCWWAQKSACTFCGINGAHNRYRQKTPKRVAAELQYLYRRYGIGKIQFTDCVLPQGWLARLTEELDANDFPHEFYAEVRADINEEMMGKYVAAGFTSLQPGIESLSDHVLSLMHKGVSAVQNVATLKFARQFDVKIFWNLLVGFPGETEADYVGQMEFIPVIEHLMPPTGVSPIVFVKDSVYYHNQEQYGLQLEPSDIYEYMSPQTPQYIEAIAYNYVDRNKTPNADIERARQKLSVFVKEWQARFVRDWKYVTKKHYGLSRLDMQIEEETVVITDTRGCRKKRIHVFSGIMKDILLYCRQPVKRRQLQEAFGKYGERFLQAVSTLKESYLLIVLGDWYLTVAVEESRKAVAEANIMEYLALLEKQNHRKQALRTAIRFRINKGEEKYTVIGEEMSKDARKDDMLFGSADVGRISRLPFD